jgi:hypothetical protein
VSVDDIHALQIKNEPVGLREGLNDIPQDFGLTNDNIPLNAQNSDGAQIFDVYVQHYDFPSAR